MAMKILCYIAKDLGRLNPLLGREKVVGRKALSSLYLSKKKKKKKNTGAA
jgi:hypothetical protein